MRKVAGQELEANDGDDDDDVLCGQMEVHYGGKMDAGADGKGSVSFLDVQGDDGVAVGASCRTLDV